MAEPDAADDQQQLGSLSWQMANGGWQMADGKWQTADGKADSRFQILVSGF
jgi:2-amino-4-hydroxy-6-hydroxymethyldihydropteridine diphosphokinase